jgi:predicted ester cyclase
MLSSTHQEIARRFFAEQDRLRGGPAGELCTSNYIAHLASNPAFDLAGHQAFASAFYAGFPDLRHTVDMAIAEGDRAAVRFSLRGCHSGDFFGIPATGRSIQITASVVMRFEAGRVAELWGEFDQAALMRQLTNPQQIESQATPGI